MQTRACQIWQQRSSSHYQRPHLPSQRSVCHRPLAASVWSAGLHTFVLNRSTTFFSSTTPFVRTRTRTLHPTPSLSCSHTLSFIALIVASSMVAMASLPSAFMAFLLLLLLGVQVNGQVARSVTLTTDLFAISDTPDYATAVILSA